MVDRPARSRNDRFRPPCDLRTQGKRRHAGRPCRARHGVLWLAAALRRAEGGISPSYPRGRAGTVRGGGKAAERRRRPLYAPRVQPAKKSGKGGRQGGEKDQAQGLRAAGGGLAGRKSVV